MTSLIKEGAWTSVFWMFLHMIWNLKANKWVRGRNMKERCRRRFSIFTIIASLLNFGTVLESIWQSKVIGSSLFRHKIQTFYIPWSSLKVGEILKFLQLDCFLISSTSIWCLWGYKVWSLPGASLVRDFQVKEKHLMWLKLLGRIGWGAKATIYALIGGLACDNAVGNIDSSASPQVSFPAIFSYSSKSLTYWFQETYLSVFLLSSCHQYS